MEIIPAIDLIDGKCVRLSQGDFARRTVYADDPVAIAKSFDDVGISRLHMVDLDGARRGSPVNLGILEAVAASTRLVIDVGGGVKRDEDVARVFDAGAAIVNVSSVAVKEADKLKRWLAEFGGERFLLAADIKGGKIAISGWQEETEIDLLPFLKNWSDRGVTQAFVTDVARDGELRGPAFETYKQVIRDLPAVKLIASGGVGSLADLEKLRAIGCSAAIVGKAIYEGRISLAAISKFINAG